MIERLKSEILKKYGAPLVYTKDCKFLADTICEKTDSRISPTTIRRLYGFLKGSTIPAKYTLNILAGYFGFKSWEHFCIYWQSKRQEELPPNQEWADFYDKALSFSKSTFQLISGMAGLPFEAIAPRLNAEKRIDQFLNSSKSALAFTAPGGYGKSCMISKWFQRNWLENQSKDVVLFLNASFMISYMNADFKLEDWIQDQIKFAQKDSLKYYLNHPEICQSRIVIVIDALDEITYDNLKLEKLFLQIKRFILNFKDSDKFKLIITSRNTTWQQFAMPFVVKENSLHQCWFDLEEEKDKINDTNLDLLSANEIQFVLDRTVNKHYKSHFNYNGLNFHQKEIVNNPFFLELFVKLYSPESYSSMDQSYAMMREYIKNKIHYSRYSEEKADILNTILELVQHGKNGVGAKKYQLREVYPVHLKTAGNYYAAYQELISYGILTEYISTNETHNFCKYVKITNEVLFETLIAIGLVDQNEGVDFALIKRVDDEYQGFELKNRLISHLIAAAVFSGKYNELKQLYKLSDESLSDSSLMSIIFDSNLCRDHVKRGLAKAFAQNQKSEMLFQNLLSTNLYLNENFKEILEVFAAYDTTKNVRIRSLSLLLISAIFSFDQKKADEYYSKLAMEEVDTSCAGFTIAVRLAAVLMYNHFIGDEDEIEMLKLFYYREMAYLKYVEQNGKLDGEFELILCMALSYMKSYHKVLQLVDDAEHLYKDEDVKNWSSNYKILMCYKIFAQKSLGLSPSEEQVDYLLNCKNEINSSGDYYLQIYYNSFLTFCFMQNDDVEKVEEFFNTAIEISEHANYHLCTTSIYKEMAKFYHGINAITKEQICISEEKRLLKKHRMNYKFSTVFV